MRPCNPAPFKSRPIQFSGALKDFEKGVLCFVIALRYKGVGPVKLILHSAEPTGTGGFCYPINGIWVVSPGTLMGCARSSSKAKAARKNGKLGGRPANKC